MSCMARVALHVAPLTLMLLMMTGCNSTPDNTQDVRSMAVLADPAGAHTRHAGPGQSDPATSFSIYDLEGEWQDQQGLSLTLADLAGRPRVIAMVYTSCAYACPRILLDMKRIEGELRTAGVDAGLLMVSIDPERDTTRRLHDYAVSTMLNPNDWTLLTGTDDGILELATLLGVRYRRVSETDFEHSNVITLLDEAGRIAYRQVGLGVEPDKLVRAASRMKN